jgi:hypothetical protein
MRAPNIPTSAPVNRGINRGTQYPFPYFLTIIKGLLWFNILIKEYPNNGINQEIGIVSPYYIWVLAQATVVTEPETTKASLFGPEF